MAAPLVVRTTADLKDDVQDVTVLLHDFSFRDPAEVLAAVAAPAIARPGGTQMPSMAMTPGVGVPDLNDYDYDAYLANDRTLADPLVIRAGRGGRVRLRLINGATSTAFWIETGTLDGTVVAADGNPVRPVTGRRFPLAEAQRLDIFVTIPKEGGAFPVLAQRERDRRRTGIVLASAGAPIRRLADMAETAPGNGAITHRIALTGSMMPYTWSLDDRTWADHVPLRASKGQRVVLEMTNRTGMAHPMHLHGHHFQVVGSCKPKPAEWSRLKALSARLPRGPDLSTHGITASIFTPDHLARSHRRTS